MTAEYARDSRRIMERIFITNHALICIHTSTVSWCRYCMMEGMYNSGVRCCRSLCGVETPHSIQSLLVE